MSGAAPFIGWIAVLLLAVATTGSAQAGGLPDWITGPIPATQDAARNGEAALATALAAVRALKQPDGQSALATTVSQEGHWTFVNASGERFTAAGADEMKRVVGVLAPALKPGTWPTLVLAEDAVFRAAEGLRSIPQTTQLYLATLGPTGLLQLDRQPGALLARVRPRISIQVGERLTFDEAIRQLARPLSSQRVRMLSLEPGGPQVLERRQMSETAAPALRPDRIDAYKLAGAVGGLRGQMVVVTGRIEADLLHFQVSSGPDRSVILGDIARAAASADVDLIVLGSNSGRQPGARNWLWQPSQVGGIDMALTHASLGDFLNAVSQGTGLLLSPATADGARVSISARPLTASTDVVSRTLGDLTATVTGRIDVTSAQLYLVSADRHRELDRRIIVWLPAWLTWVYLAALLLGALGSAVSWRWWATIWPPEQQSEYPIKLGYYAASAARATAYLLFFMPLVGLAALPMMLLGMVARRQPA